MRHWQRAFISTSALLFAISFCGHAQTAPAAASATPVTRALGTIKSIAADTLTVAPDTGPEITATVSATTKIVRVPPGEKDLKNATPIQVQDLQPGDRILVRGQAAPEGRSIAALSVIVMKQSDVSAKQTREREDWQKRGVGGLVSAVDATAGTITISVSSFAGTHNLTVRTTKDTILRRYAPGSVKFDDARPAPLDQIKPGDQLRARGTRSPGEMVAEEIVSGTFRNIAGTIAAIDPATNSLTVQDAIAKAPVQVKLSAETQIKKLPPEMAQRIAFRMKAAAGLAGGAPAETPAPAMAPGNRPTGEGMQYPRAAAGPPNGQNGPPDFQRFLGRLPNSSLSDLQKGDAVMIVSTADGNSAAVLAITMLAGVEPILTASPTRSAAMMLSPWTLGGGAGGDAEAGGGGPQ